MVFSSLLFLTVFLPIVFILHSVIQNIWWRNGLLIAASLCFYAYGEPVYVLLLIISALINYLGAWRISEGNRKKLVLAIVVILNIGILCVFKYTGFIVDTINQVGGVHISAPQIVLPIGISFFTFQALSYVIDVYRGIVDAQKNYFKVLLYISFFPQLIAGPIVKYRDICGQIMNRTVTLKESARGMQRFVVGLSKKVLIANTMGIAADSIFQADAAGISIVTAWIGAIAYLLQIYYDFSGYSDMAIGLGRMFGFHFKENFLFPYSAVSIRDFWHKWHVSLSGWFKDYLYIPLGGNRKGQVRTCTNKIIVFFLTGLWHGANWTFIVWGLFHGLFLLLEDFIPALKRLPRVVSHIYVLLVVTVGFVMFRADTFSQGILFIRNMFAGFEPSSLSLSLAAQQMTPWFITMLIAGIAFMAPLKRVILACREKLEQDTEALGNKEKWLPVLCAAVIVALLVWCMLRLSGSTYNPFIYFRF